MALRAGVANALSAGLPLIADIDDELEMAIAAEAAWPWITRIRQGIGRRKWRDQ